MRFDFRGRNHHLHTCIASAQRPLAFNNPMPLLIRVTLGAPPLLPSRTVRHCHSRRGLRKPAVGNNRRCLPRHSASGNGVAIAVIALSSLSPLPPSIHPSSAASARAQNGRNGMANCEMKRGSGSRRRSKSPLKEDRGMAPSRAGRGRSFSVTTFYDVVTTYKLQPFLLILDRSGSSLR